MQVTVTVVTSEQSFPAGTTSGNLRYEIQQNGVDVVKKEVPDLSTTFDLADGGYTAVVSRLDATGATVIGTPATATFTVTSPPVMIAIPQTVTVTM